MNNGPDGRRTVAIALIVVGGVLLATGVVLNVLIARLNVVTGQETHPYDVVGWIIFVIGIFVFGAGASQKRRP